MQNVAFHKWNTSQLHRPAERSRITSQTYITDNAPIFLTYIRDRNAGDFLFLQKRGGDSMLSDAIQTVKDAEAEAEARIIEAKNRAASIVKQAGMDADRIRKDAEQEAAADYSEEMEAAKEAGEQLLREASAAAGQECARLRQKAAEQEPAAIENVIRLVLGG